MSSKHPRFFKWVKRTGLGFLGLVALLVLMVAGVLTYVATPSGGERVRRLVVEKVNAGIQGHLAVSKLSLRETHLILTGVELRGPDGDVVARLQELEVKISIAQLLHKRVDVTLLRLSNPQLFLKQGDHGMNLGAAITPRHSTPKKPERKVGSKKLGSLGIEVDRLEISSGPDLNAWGSAKMDGDQVSAELHATAGSAKADVQGAFNLATRGSDGVAEDFDAKVDLDVPRSKMGSELMGPIRFHGTAHQGHFLISELFAQVPGLRLTAQGQGTRKELSISGRLVADNLAVFSKTLGWLAGHKGSSLKGQGTLTFAISGPLTAPHLHAQSSFPALVSGAMGAYGLGLYVEVPNAKSLAGAKLHLVAKSILLGPKKRLHDVHLNMDGTGRKLSLQAVTHGFAELQLSARARLSESGRGGVLNALSLQYPEARWDLQKPVVVALRPKGFVVSPVLLRAGEQTVSVRASQRSGRLDSRVTLKSFDLGQLPKAFVDPKLGFGGILNLDVRAKGRSSGPDIVAKVDLHGGRVKKYSNVDLHLDASYKGDRALGSVKAEGAGIHLTGAFDVPVKALKTGRAEPVKVELEMAELELEEPLKDLGLKNRVRGTASAKLSVEGSAADPKLHFALNGKQLSMQEMPPADLTFAMDSAAEGKLRARVDLSTEGKKSFIEMRAPFTLGALIRKPPSAAVVMRSVFELRADVRELPLSLLSQVMTQRSNVDPATAPPKVNGTLSGQLTVKGTPQDPSLTLKAQAKGLSAEGSPAGDVFLRFDYRRAREAVDLVMRSVNGGQIHLAAEAPIDLSYPAVGKPIQMARATLHAQLTAKDFDVSFLSNFGGSVEKLGGLLEASAQLQGSLQSPQLNGQIEWKNGILFTRGEGDLKNIHLLARADNNRLELKEVTAKSEKGTARLTALAQRRGGNDFKLHVTADLNKFPVMSDGQLAATVSLRSSADGNVSPTRLYISKLAIPEARIQLPDVQKRNLEKLDAPADVLLTLNGKPVKGPSDVKEGNATRANSGIKMAVVVDAPRNLWISGNDVNTEVGLSDGFRIEYAMDRPQLFGDVNVVRGRLDMFGRRFDFQRDSKVTFTGPPTQPSLAVTAEYKNETEQVRVYLKAQGQADKLELKPSSDPPLPDTEIFTLLATGHTSLHHGSGTSSPSGEAASLVGSLAATQLKKTLASKLPLDVLSIEAGDNGLEGAKLEAGTYVNDRFYVGFTGRIGADPMRGENSNEVDLEYQLSKRWSVNGDYGDARAGGASLNWRKEY